MPGTSHQFTSRRTWSAVVMFTVAALGLAGAAAAVLRQLPEPYWFDEVLTLRYVREPISRMLRYVANDWFPPAYYFVLKPWLALAGDSEAATGGLSLLWVLLAIGLTYGLGRALWSPTVAGRGAVLFGVSQAALYFATETRMYAMLMALAVGSTWALVQLLNAAQRWPRYLTYGALVLLGGYTHYAFWFLVLAQNVGVWLWHRLGGSSLRVGRWVTVQVLAALLYLPQVAVLAERVLRSYLAPDSNWLDQDVVSWQLVWRIPLELLLSNDVELPAWLPRAVLLAMGALLAALLAQFRLQAGALQVSLRPFTPPVALLLSLLALPLAILYALNVSSGRYLIFTAPFLCLLLAVGSVHFSRPAAQRWAFTVIVALLASGNTVAAFTAPQLYHTTPWPVVAAYLARQPAAPGTVIAAHFYDGVVLSYYYRGSLPVVALSPIPAPPGGDWLVAQSRSIGKHRVTERSLAVIAPQLSGARTVWLVRGGEVELYDERGLLDEIVARHCADAGDLIQLPAPSWRYDNITIRPYERCEFPAR